MKRFILITEESVKQGGEELLVEWQMTKKGWIWLDLHEEDAKIEEEFLRKNFSLDEFEIIEAQRLRHPPSIQIPNRF